MWSRIRPRCATSLGKSIAVAFSNSRSPREYEFATDTLEQAVKEHGCPKRIRVDNGPEFVSRDLDLWAHAKGVVLDFSRPGKPTDNAYTILGAGLDE